MTMQREMRTDSEWSAIERQACRVIDFTPFASVEDGKVVAPDISGPYASVTLECAGMPSAVKGFVTHKVDFANLWEAFEERGVSDDEEVVIFWTSKDYRYKFLRFFSRVLPKIWVTIRPKGAYDLMTDRNCKPELSGEARARATLPIAVWKPEIMR